jgi:hypothetical protein
MILLQLHRGTHLRPTGFRHGGCMGETRPPDGAPRRQKGLRPPELAGAIAGQMV